MQIVAQTLLTYEWLEAKFISEETSIWLETQQKEDGEAFLLHWHIAQRFQLGPKAGHHFQRLNNRNRKTFSHHKHHTTSRFGEIIVPSQPKI